MTSVTNDDVLTTVKNWHIGDPDLSDPYPFFKGLREQCPVARSERFDGYYVVASYEDQREVLKDPYTYASSILFIPPVEDPVGKYIPLQIDPPDLQAYRAAFGPFFAPQAAERLETSTRALARKLLDQYVSDGGGDFIEKFCIPFPVVTMLLHLGLPVEDMTKLLVWKDSIIRDGLSGDPERIAKVGTETYPALLAYYKRVLDEREAMADPPPDILTGLVRAKFRDRSFTRDEMVRSLHLFFQAGLDTVTSVLSLSMHYLATHPDKRRELHKHPELIPTAVEELMRFHSSVTVCRQATKDVELGGVQLKAGDKLMLPTASAGRDEAEFPNADEVDFSRTPNRHLGFGGGPHRCIGSHIGRMELRLALEEIDALMPDYEITNSDEVERHWGGIFGVDKLPLTVIT